ncbi:MAG: MBL fold metallo-hydrolase [Clostridiales bacterium]|nr:MBL fold metallo-hydrolase [Clostridiales bacterium]
MITFDIGLGGYSILQNANQDGGKTMSYIISTPNRKVIVIDGGRACDADDLRTKIMHYGGTVHMWHISHAHNDHIGAFIDIMEDKREIKVESIYWDFPPLDWMLDIQPGNIRANVIFPKIIEQNKDISTRVQRGMKFLLDGLELEILSDSHHYSETNNINETSVAYRIKFPNKVKAIFLADMMEMSGRRLAYEYGDELKADIVQIAHHGQRGVPRQVYELIEPKLCLWPTPQHIWENDNGDGYNTGPWRTLQIQDWLDEIGVKKHGIMKDGEIIVI